MGTLAVTWVADNAVRIVQLEPGVRSVIGRSPDVSIFIDDPTISRQHVAITPSSRPLAAPHRLDHLSLTNPTHLNKDLVENAKNLHDGDVLMIGTALVTFHDLAAQDRQSGPICHVCRRENEPSDRDCWFCGTSLLNAPTTIRQARPVICRVVSASGAVADLYAERALVLKSDGAADSVRQPVPSGSIGIAIGDGEPVLLGVGSTDVAEGQPIRTGLQVAVDGAVFGVIAREGPSG